jgi:hypothetical protein
MELVKEVKVAVCCCWAEFELRKSSLVKNGLQNPPVSLHNVS